MEINVICTEDNKSSGDRTRREGARMDGITKLVIFLRCSITLTSLLQTKNFLTSAEVSLYLNIETQDSRRITNRADPPSLILLLL
jgi:hypothetical protein